MSNKILRHGHTSDTAANWRNNNPILGKGEIAIESDTGKFKFGNGVNNYNDINYSSSSSINNILDGTGTSSLQQSFDGSETLNFTGKNPALTADNVGTYFGSGADISKLPRGGVGNFATSLGGKSVAKGKRSTAEGTTTIAVGAYSHTEGDNTVTLGADSHAEGYETSAEGNASHSEGGGTHAKGNHSHTEGGLTKTTTGAEYGHAEGLSTEVSGKYSHSEGSSTKAQGITSHSEGQETVASGDISHSEGYKTKATGNHAHSEGSNTIASADSAHSEGGGTEATSISSHAEGSETKTGALVDLSQPDPDEPSPPSAGGGSGEGGTGEGGGTSTPTISTGASHSEGYRTSAFGWGSHSEGGSTVAYNHYSHAEGERTKAYGEGSHTEGLATITGDEADLTKGKGAHAEGYATKATGGHAHAEGYGTEATGAGSHSEGENTTASGEYAHSEGEGTVASGYISKAFGQGTKATATRSVAGGYNAEANGDTSFSFGFNTKTTNEGEVAFGKYNKSNANTLFSIGIGQYDGDGRRNAFEVTTDGKVTIPLLQDYYTKTQVDSKLSSVYKFVGSISTPMLIPSVTHQKGDVYNCRWGGRIPNDYSSSRTITALTYTKVSDTSYTGTITFSEDITYDLMYAEEFGITIEGYSDTQMFLTGRITNAHSGDVSECSELKFQVDPTKFSDYEIQISGLYNNPIIEFLNTVSGITSPISCTACNISRNSYVTHQPEYFVSNGGNIAYTGTNDPYYWDALGTTIDISTKADKSTTLAGYGITNAYTKTEVDNKIAASGGTGDPNTVIISSAADFSTTQTFTKKTIKIAEDIDLPANSTITFNNCIIHGLSKITTITTYGDNLTFTNCNIYDLTILGIGDSPTSSLNVKLTLTNCKLNNCSVYGSNLYSSFLSDCTFVNSSYSTPAIGQIYFSGNTTFIGGSITQTDGNGSLTLVKNSRTFINGTNIDMQITGATLFKNEINGNTSSLSLIGCYEKNNKTINIATDITTTPVLATLNTLNFTPITQAQE